MTLDVAGRGPLEPALKAYARELGLEDAVRFLGFVSPVQRAIEDAAIVVVPRSGRASAWSRSRRWSGAPR